MLKIIAGDRRGTKLYTLEGDATRPLRGRIRESLFNVIQFEVPGRKVLDLFAGSGAVGLEALSRGAESVVFVESSPKARAIVARNIAKLRYEEQTTIIEKKLPEALKSLEPEKRFDLVFITPPYNSGLANPVLENLRPFVEEYAIIVVEVQKDEEVEVNLDSWELVKEKTYGVTKLLFIEPK